jgi:K+-transporting ATPase ATPase A chain
MTADAFIQTGVYLAILLLLARPLGLYMARVYLGRATWMDRIAGPVERVLYRLAGVAPDAEMTWKRYGAAMLVFNLAGFLALYALQRAQGWLPLNPPGLPVVTPDLAFNTAASFTSNTNWQSYGGETTMAPLVQMLGLAVQNFLSAATGMAILAALIRGLTRRSATTIGNFWVDMTRSVLHILLPLSLVTALVLVTQGVVQTFGDPVTARLVQAPRGGGDGAAAERTLVTGAVASQVAIKQLGTNGGGHYNVNSAHPFENPTPLSNFAELIAILLIPAALCHTFGRMVRDRRQGRALLAAMTVAFAACAFLTIHCEQAGGPALHAPGVDRGAGPDRPGGNMEGKEVRFGVVSSALWATATTAASNGSVNAMHDSFTPLGGLVPLVLIQAGEVIFGGVGSGLYGMLVFVLVTVFVAGLMVGRTPEYLGKKIEAFEIKMASLALLAPAATVLAGTAAAVIADAGRSGPLNPGPHGFSEILYAFSSAGNNNGSAFAGLSADSPFYNVALGLAMLVGRYWVALPVLAIAGSLAAKKKTVAGPGTFPTDTPLFVGLLLGVVLVVGALTFLPALALGPIVEHLTGVVPGAAR